jgi:hypothetical protein
LAADYTSDTHTHTHTHTHSIDPEKTTEEAYTKEGIAFHVNLVNALQSLAVELNVDPLVLKQSP